MTQTYSHNTIEADKTNDVLGVVLASAKGPYEAYGILCLTIYRLNFEFCEEPMTMVELCDALTLTMRSITKIGTQ